MKRGLFITLEGNDGAGKTTMAKKALEYLQKKDIERSTQENQAVR